MHAGETDRERVPRALAVLAAEALGARGAMQAQLDAPRTQAAQVIAAAGADPRGSPLYVLSAACARHQGGCRTRVLTAIEHVDKVADARRDGRPQT